MQIYRIAYCHFIAYSIFVRVDTYSVGLGMYEDDMEKKN